MKLIAQSQKYFFGYLKTLRFFSAKFSTVFIFKSCCLPSKANRLQVSKFMWRSEVLFTLEIGKMKEKAV